MFFCATILPAQQCGRCTPILHVRRVNGRYISTLLPQPPSGSWRQGFQRASALQHKSPWSHPPSIARLSAQYWPIQDMERGCRQSGRCLYDISSHQIGGCLEAGRRPRSEGDPSAQSDGFMEKYEEPQLLGFTSELVFLDYGRVFRPSPCCICRKYLPASIFLSIVSNVEFGFIYGPYLTSGRRQIYVCHPAQPLCPHTAICAAIRSRPGDDSDLSFSRVLRATSLLSERNFRGPSLPPFMDFCDFSW